MPKTRRRFRLSLMTALVIAFAGTTFIGVIYALSLGFSVAVGNTLGLLYEAVEDGIDGLVETVEQRTKGLEERSAWVAARVAEGSIDPTNQEEWDRFLRTLPSGRPKVAAVALIDEDFQARGIFASDFTPFAVSLSHNFALIEEINQVTETTPADWTPPLWSDIIGEPFFVLKQPLFRNGAFKGMFVQLLSVSDISKQLRNQQQKEGSIFTPFVLYARDKVLAHPSLTILSKSHMMPDSMPVANFIGNENQPLPALSEVHDPILRQIWSSKGTVLEAFALGRNRDRTGEVLTEDELRVRQVEDLAGEHHHIAYKEIDWAGPAKLVVGAHYDTQLLSELEDSFKDNMLEGIIVLVTSVAVAVLAARYLSNIARSNAAAVAMVGKGDLDAVPQLPPSVIKELDQLGRTFNEMVVGLKERTRIRQLFGRYVPDAVAHKLLSSDGDDLEAELVTATVSFTDLEGFTRLSEELRPTEIVEMLNSYFAVISEIIERNGGIITQFQGDAVLAIYNAPVELPDHEMAAVTAAREIFDAVNSRTFAGRKVACRTGITTGELVSGSVGAPERRTYTVHGDVVNTAARLEALNKELGTRILLGPVTAAAVRGQVPLEARGSLDIRGKRDTVPVYAVPTDQTVTEPVTVG